LYSLFFFCASPFEVFWMTASAEFRHLQIF